MVIGKRRFIICPVVLLFVILIAVAISAPQFSYAEEIIEQGECGEDAAYTIVKNDENYYATISGTGETADYEYGKNPFASYPVKKVVIENGITKIGVSLCSGCYELENVVLPETLEVIGVNAFMETNISKIDIPKGVSYIKSGAFAFCQSLTSVDIPESMLYIDNSAFVYDVNLKRLNIEPGVRTIGKTAFSGCGIESVELPDTVEAIGEQCFSLCQYLKDVKLPAQLEEIPNQCFDYCYSLQNITMPKDLQTIGDSAFSRCDSLATISLPKGLKKIGAKAFFSADGLETITIPNKVISMGTHCFCSCSKLKTVKLSSKMTEIPESSFEDCYELQKVTVPVGIEIIDTAAFNNCRSLTQISLPKGLKKIRKNAFQNTDSLEKLIVPSTVTFISSKVLGKNGKKNIAYKSSQNTRIIALTGDRYAFTVEWARRSMCNTGYQIQYSTNKKFKSGRIVKVKDTKTNTKFVTNLKAKKRYYVRVRTYHTVGKKTYFGKWSRYWDIRTK